MRSACRKALKSVSQPLERDRAVSFDRLIDEIAAGRPRRRCVRDAGRPAGGARSPDFRQGPYRHRKGGRRPRSRRAGRAAAGRHRPRRLGIAGAEGRSGAGAAQGTRGGQGQAAELFDDPALRRLLKDVKAAADIRIDTISTVRSSPPAGTPRGRPIRWSASGAFWRSGGTNSSRCRSSTAALCAEAPHL